MAKRKQHSQKIAQANRFRVPPHPRKAGAAVLAAPLRTAPVSIVSIDGEPVWRRVDAEGNRREEIVVHAHLSDGAVLVRTATCEYEEFEREKILEQAFKPISDQTSWGQAKTLAAIRRIIDRRYNARCLAIREMQLEVNAMTPVPC